VQQYQNITGHPLATPPGAPTPLLNPSQTLAPPTPGTGAGNKANAPPLPSAPPAPPVTAPGPELRPPPSPNAPIPAPPASGDLQVYAQQAAAKYGVPWNIFYYLIDGESSWNPNAVGPPVQDAHGGTINAQGIAQFMPGIATQQGVNPSDPRSSLDGAARYLATLNRQYGGDWVKTITAYNQGEGNANNPPDPRTLAVPSYRVAYQNAGYTQSDAKWQGFVDDAQAGYRQKAADASAAMGEALKQIKAGDITLGEAMTRIRAAQDKADDAQQTALQAIAQQPKAPVMDGVKHLSGLATIVGVLGGLLTRQPMLASLNAGAAAIEAYNSGDLRNYQLAHDNWKNQTDLLFKIAGMQAQRVHDVMSEEDIPIQWQHAKLDSTLRAMDLGMVADQARIEGSNVALDWAYKIDQAQLERERYQREYDKPILTYDKNTGQYANVYPLSGKIQYLPKGFTPTGSAAGRGSLPPAAQAEVDRRDALIDPSLPEDQQAAQRFRNLTDVTREWSASQSRAGGTPAAQDENAYVDAYVAGKIAEKSAQNPNYKPDKNEIATLRMEGRGEAKNVEKGIGVISDAAADLMAQQMVLGDKAALAQLPRSGPSRTKVENRFAELLKDQPDGARNTIMNRLRLLEAETAARTAGRVTMQTEIFAKEATDAGAEVIRTSKLVPRTDTPMFNKALEAYYRQEGDPNIIAFGASLSALINAYGKMSNPTGTGVHDADKERIQSTIDTALAQGQIEAGVNQIITEGRIIAGAAQAAQIQVLQGLAPTGITPPGTAPPAAAAPPPPPAGSADTAPPGSPPGTKKAPDGHWYAPPDQPGGPYRRVDP
jgi:Transglycosylase SLT domain